MGEIHALPGVIAVVADRLISIVRVEDDGSIVVRDLANGGLSTTSASELRAMPSLSDVIAPTWTTIAKATDAQWERAHRREAVIAGIVGSTDVADQVTVAANRLGVSRRTVFRWLALYREAPQTSSLLPHPRGTPAGAHRIDQQVEHIIDEVIRDVYLTKVRARKEEVFRQVQLRCAAAGLAVPSRKPILARLKALDVRKVARARLQSGEEAALHRPVPGTYHIEHPLDVVQIDHTRVDVIVVDETHRMPIGRPWLTLAIDVATRVVVGFYVSLEAPSSTSVALCLTQAVLPKEPWLNDRSLQCTWPVWGLPRAVHADNGPDFRSAALSRGCNEHGIALILRPIATPHYGGHIERLIGTLMGRVHLLPGTTGSNPQDKGDYPAESESRLTMAELEKWLAIEICEQYHRRIHRGLHRSPLAAWKEASSKSGGAIGALPDRPDQFTISFLPFEQRILRRDGLHLFHIRYWDSSLPTIGRLGEPVLIRYDPRNLSKIYVARQDGQYQPIPYADLGLPPISLWEQRAAMAKLHDQGDNAPAQAAMFKAVIEQRELVAQASVKTKAARRQIQRRKDATRATATPPQPVRDTVDYSQPVSPSNVEVWED